MTFGGARLGPYLATLGATARRDPQVKAALLFFVAGGIVSAFLSVTGTEPPWLEGRAGFLGELGLLALLVLSLIRGSGEISGRESGGSGGG